MITRTALDALNQRPSRFIRSSWPWRSLAYLAGSLIPGACVVIGAAMVIAYAELDALGLGTLVLTVIVLFTPVITVYERWRVRLVDLTPMQWRLFGWRGFAHALVTTIALWWIDLGLVALSLGIPGMLLTAPLQPTGSGPFPSALLVCAGLLLIPVAAYPITAWAGARAAVSRAILLPGDAEEVRKSRARLMGAFESERRRIERDLHDGAQQRLVALTMNLGVAKLTVPPDSESYAAVEQAHEQAKAALAELREIIRGVHPQILSGRGLGAAVRDTAGRSPIPVEVRFDVPRLPEAIEVNVFYAVSEALANVAKHSNASQAWVSGSMRGGRLHVEVGDNGGGGAHFTDSGGLTGLADRVATVDGRLALSSPRGGPTLIRVEVPCTG